MSKKGENIYKRKDNRWEARFIKGYHSNGSPKYGYCYGKTYREAKQKVTSAKAALISGKPLAPLAKKRRFAYYCDEWLQLNRNRVKESTYVKYNSILEKYVKPRLGGCYVQALSSIVIEQFSHELLFEEELSPKTVKDILTMLHGVLVYARKQFTDALPELEIVYPKVPKNEMRVLTIEEQKRLIAYLLKDMDKCKFGVLLALLTGMRIGEVCALRWENISLKERTIKIESTMQRIKDFDDTHSHKTKVIITDPKTYTSIRILPLTEYLVKLCSAFSCENPVAFVLTGEANNFVEPRVLQYKFERYASECGLKEVHFHTLRHTFATRCVEVDFEIKSLSEILGHSSPRITLERYVHSSMELKRSNMDKLTTIGW